MSETFPEGFNRADFADDPDMEDLVVRFGAAQQKADALLSAALISPEGTTHEERDDGGLDPAPDEKNAALMDLQQALSAVQEVFRQIRGLAGIDELSERQANQQKSLTENALHLLTELELAVKRAEQV